MSLNHLPTYLTTREIADLIRLTERKVYDLVASGQIPHVKATGKLLFPRDLIEGWLARHTEGAAGGRDTRRRPPIVAGSSDPLLDWAVRESGSGLAVGWGGSLDGLDRFAAGDSVAAGLHIAEDGEAGWNVETVRHRLFGEPVVLIGWARRTQGLIVPPGNPLGIRTLSDIVGRRVIMRQPQAGAHVLLQRLLAVSDIKSSALKVVAPPALTEADVAAAVAEGRADAGLAIAAVAKQYQLGFVPLMEERYDLLIWRSAYFEPAVQKLVAFARDPRFAERAAALTGYDLAEAGVVRFNAP